MKFFPIWMIVFLRWKGGLYRFRVGREADDDADIGRQRSLSQ